MYNVVIFNKEEKYIEDFLKLPKKLYKKNEIMQNIEQEREILLEKHVLNKYFEQYKILIYKDNEIAGRCIVTIYYNSNVAYIGYFECINDEECAKKIFETAEEIVRKKGITKIQGPVDSSFWIKYRLKIDNFRNTPYTDEPYNKDYYINLFEKNDYKIIHTYTSKQYGKVKPQDFQLEKERYSEAIKKGYEFKSPKPKEFLNSLNDIYDLVSELFSDFPVYNQISREDFIEIFKDYKLILDWKLVKLVYYKGEAVAFSLGVPDYKNIIYGKITLIDIIKIFFKKIRSKNYCLLYMGVKPEHKGLGRPLVYEMSEFVKKKNSTSIGALQGENRKTNEYAKEKIDDIYTYGILEKNI